MQSNNVIEKIDTLLKKKTNQAKKSVLDWFNSDKKLAIIVSIVTGIITHILMITSTIFSQDGLWNSMKVAKPGDWEVSLGRWGIVFAEKLNFYLAIPSITTISCVLVMAVASVFVVDLFKFKKKIYIVFTSILLVVAPSFTVTMLYVYTALAYSINFLLSTLVIWFIYKSKNKKVGFCLAGVCFIFALGIYQSYMGVTIGLCIMLEILSVLRKEKTFKESFFDMCKIAIVVLIYATSYYLITNFILAYKKLHLSAYKGADDSNIYTIVMGLKNTIYMTYRDFVVFFFGDRIVYNRVYSRNKVYLILFIITAFFGLVSIIRLNKDYSKSDGVFNFLWILFLLICLPVGLNIIDIIAINTEIYILTASQLILIAPFCLAIIDNIDNYEVLKICASLCMAYILLTYYVSDNVTYTVEKLTYNQAYSTVSRILDRVENLQGYSKDLPIMIAGIVGNDNYPRVNDLYKYSSCDISNSTVFHFTYGGEVETWRNFINIFFGLNLNFCDDNTYYQLYQSPEFKDMGKFPEPNSVRIIHGIVVVKLHEEPPLPAGY